MTDISRVSLFGKLDPLAFRSVESAAAFCKLRGNPYVELEHWIHQILQQPASDLHMIARAFDLNATALARDVNDALDRLPRGATSVSDISGRVEDATERAWVWATLRFGATSIRTGHLIVAILKTRELRNSAIAISRELAKIRVDELVDDFDRFLARSPEESAATTATTGAPEEGGETTGAVPGNTSGKQAALARFTVDLTAQARRGEIDPVVGRDEEIRQIIDILMRRRQNNPILAGEAGVGKTAIVEGLARRIVAGDVPPPLKAVTLRALDIGLLQAGASMKGEFEQRLRQIIDEVQSSPSPIVLFIDEVHTLVGAGGAAGTGDAANLLKPALARGTLRTIGATTWAEYKKHIEKDPALTRRFQAVKVDEPDEENALGMMRSLITPMEKHHRVHILDAALEAAVRLSHRYIADRQLPDKAVSLLDTACARVAVGRFAMPAEVEDCQHRIESLKAELAILEREAAVGLANATRETSVRKRLEEQGTRLESLREAWTREKTLVEQIIELRSRLQEAAASPADSNANTRDRDVHQLERLQRELEVAQAGRPLLQPQVDASTVASVVADWTGIPLGRMVKDEISVVLSLADTLGERVIGQRPALEMITRRVQTTRASLENPGKPAGVFLLAGPSGVGKTETALALAEALYGGEQNLITINMSEFQESHTVSTLKGSPPGYVGYGEGGVLTESVRRKPYSVVLLDEVEKAHPDVHEIFYQVFDKGVMEDGEGRQIDFRNTLIILTTNVGSELLMAAYRDPQKVPEDERLAKVLRTTLLEAFPAALLGRMVVVPYRPLGDEVLGRIIRLQLDRVVDRLQRNHGAALRYTPEVVDLIAARCTEPESGGRMIEAILTNTVLPGVSRELLSRMSTDRVTRAIELGITDGEFSFVFE
jgi:type VI secretion system protein VasG